MLTHIVHPACFPSEFRLKDWILEVIDGQNERY